MEPKLIEIKKAKNIVFVGDTHGDLEVSQKVIKDYLKPGNKIVFLGDYVDRGHFSRENLDFLLKVKKENPEKIYLLQGNHEGHRIFKFSPAEFWESLSKKDYERYSSVVEKFPLVVVTDSIIALHAALPNLEKLEDFKKIKIGDENWFRICWGDFYDEPGESLGNNFLSGRPQFGKDYFFRLMEKFNKKVLIRSHQPNTSLFMFNDRCITIFTSLVYHRERIIAVADLSKPIKDAHDLKLKKI